MRGVNCERGVKAVREGVRDYWSRSNVVKVGFDLMEHQGHF